MQRLCRVAVTSVLAACLAAWAVPTLADCVSCGPGGECFVVSPGFSGNCECKVRSVNGATVCTPSGVCDPSDPTTCSAYLPQPLTASRGGISTLFINDLAEKNALLAGAVWGGLSGNNSSPKAEPSGRAAGDITGTMRKGGKNYTYRTRLRRTAEDAFSIKVHIEEDGRGQGQDYEGIISSGGQSGHLVKVGPRGKSAVYSWETR